MTLPARRREALTRDLSAALPSWVTVRLLVAGSVATGLYAFNRLHPAANAVRLHEGLLAWDGQWYQRIANRGYGPIAREALRFFPLYPLLARVVHLGTRLGTGAALVILANLAALGLGILVHRLVLVERDDPALARRSAWYIALVPSAFVLVLAYPESIAGCLAVAVFLAIRTGRWAWSALFGFLAGLARPVGVLLAVPVVVEAIRAAGGLHLRGLVTRLPAAAAPLAGMAVYLAWVQVRFGHALLPFRVQQADYLRGGLQNPASALVRSGVDFFRGSMEPNGMHFPWAVLLIVLVVASFRFWPASYGAFAAATLLVALSARRLGSLERYGFGAFPVALTLASVTARPHLDRMVSSASGGAVFGYSLLTFLNIYVP